MAKQKASAAVQLKNNTGTKVPQLKRTIDPKAPQLRTPSVDQNTPTFDREKNMRRLNVNLPPNVYAELQRLAAQSNRSLTDIVRTGLSLAQVVLTETADGERKLALTDKEGKAIKEIVLLR
jgi:hypothetical protein